MPTQVAKQTTRVEGLRELTAALRDADKGFARELRKAEKKAAQLVVTEGRALAGAAGAQAALAAKSLRAGADARAAKVMLGGDRYPFAFGANWGALHDVERTTTGGRTLLGWNQFPGFTKHQDRFLYRAIEKTTPEPFLGNFTTAVDELLRRIEREHPYKSRSFRGSTIG